jgi:hypothetical protein
MCFSYYIQSTISGKKEESDTSNSSQARTKNAQYILRVFLY